MKRPGSDEFLAYYAQYINLVGDGDIVSVLEAQNKQTVSQLRAFSDAQGKFRYAPGKWSINEVVGHLIDAERLFSTRALRFAREDPTPLPGFDENAYAKAANYDDLPLSELASEFEAVRRSTCFLYRHMTEEATARRGKANNAEVSVRALAYITAGHELHHRGVIADRYKGAKG